MPPPDVVTANTQRVTNGTISTPEEVFERAIDAAETMSDEELELIFHSFETLESVYEMTRRSPWSNKLGRMGHLAFNAVTTELEKTAHRSAVKIYELPERMPLRRERKLAKKLPINNTEQHTAYFQNEPRRRAAANEKGRLWDEQDEKLFAEVKESMMKMVDELESGKCYCKECSKQ